MLTSQLNTFDQKVLLNALGFLEVNLGLLSLLAVQEQGSELEIGGAQSSLVADEKLFANFDGFQVVLFRSFDIVVKSRVFSSSEGAVNPQGAYHLPPRILFLLSQQFLFLDIFAFHEIVQNLEGKGEIAKDIFRELLELRWFATFGLLSSFILFVNIVLYLGLLIIKFIIGRDLLFWRLFLLLIELFDYVVLVCVFGIFRQLQGLQLVHLVQVEFHICG